MHNFIVVWRKEFETLLVKKRE